MAALCAAVMLGACQTGSDGPIPTGTAAPTTTGGAPSPSAGVTQLPSPTSSAPTSSTAVVPLTPTTVVPLTPSAASPTPTAEPTTEPSPADTRAPDPVEGATLRAGDSGGSVTTVQQRLSDLGYWLGEVDGEYGSLTTQAVLALQKAAGLARDGVFGPNTRRALTSGVRPSSRIGGTGTEVDKRRQLLLIVRGGQVTMILDTSTGSGETYVSQGRTRVATTPAGRFAFYRSVNGEDVGPLGALWRPRYFNGGIAVHGYTSVPAYPASHGCVRVSNAAMNMIWARNLMPIGSRVVVY